MHRTISALIALLIGAVLIVTPMAHAASECAAGECVYLPLVLVIAPPGVAIDGQPFTYTDSSSSLHIIGDVLNTLDRSVEHVGLTAHIFDRQGQLVATASSYARLNPIPTYTSACFELLLPSPADGTGLVQLEKPTYTTTDTPMPRLQLWKTIARYEPIPHSIVVTGLVINGEPVRVTSVRVSTTVYNAAEQAIGCASILVHNGELEPGQMSDFTMYIGGRDYSDFTHSKIQVAGNK